MTPLVAIIEMQILELQNLGVKAINLADDEINVNDETENKMKSGQYFIIFGTPETWIKQEKWYYMLTSELFQKKTLIIVADEAHSRGLIARLSGRVGWGKRSQMGQSKSCDIFNHELIVGQMTYDKKLPFVFYFNPMGI